MLRFWVHTPPTGFPAWVDIALKYLKAFKESGLPVKAISSSGALDMQVPGWDCVGSLFGEPARDSYSLNVVCGFGCDFSKLHTEGIRNVAITACAPRWPNDNELAALARFDCVYAISDVHTAILKALGIAAEHLPPTAEALSVFREPL
jgi:hypothetical protein